MKFSYITVILLLIIFYSIPAVGYSETTGVELGDTITVRYDLTFENGTYIQSNENFTSELSYDKLIDGFVNGLLGMKIDEMKSFVVPPEEGYTNPDHQLYGETLNFDVYLIDVIGYTPDSSSDSKNDNPDNADSEDKINGTSSKTNTLLLEFENHLTIFSLFSIYILINLITLKKK